MKVLPFLFIICSFITLYCSDNDKKNFNSTNTITYGQRTSDKRMLQTNIFSQAERSQIIDPSTSFFETVRSVIHFIWYNIRRSIED